MAVKVNVSLDRLLLLHRLKSHITLFFTQIIIRGILWVRAKNYERLVQEKDAVRSDASIIFLMGDILGPEELNDSCRKTHIRELWMEVKSIVSIELWSELILCSLMVQVLNEDGIALACLQHDDVAAHAA
jgi:hypothetical protein